jgi:autotransporter-associated beta strand protein
MPCDTSFRRLDVTVCWEPVENASEIVNYSGCNDISLWLSDCTRGNCKTTLVYSGTGVTSTINVDVRGDATIEANGSGALVFANDFSYIADPACDPTLTLSGTSTAANEMSTIKQQLYTLTSLVKTGSGRWVLSKNNLHGGTNELRNGTLEIAIATLPSAGALGTLPAALQMTGADGPVTLLLAGGVTFTKWVAVTTEGGAATIGGADAGTSAFNDPTSFILAGRPLTLQAATGGTVEFRNNWNNATGDEYPSVDITIGSNGNTGTVLLTADLSTTGTVTVAHGTLHVTGASGQFQFADEVVVSGAAAELRYDSDINMERPLSLTAGTLSGDATINTVAVSNAPTIRVDTGDEIEIDDELSGSGTLAKTGAGTLRLAASTFSGTLNILAGEVVLEQIKTNPGGLVSTATFSNTALSVAFTGDPVTDDEFVLLSGPTTQTYTPTLTGTTKTGTYNASTSTLTID